MILNARELIASTEKILLTQAHCTLEAASPRQDVYKRQVYGGPAPEAVQAQIANVHRQCR